MTIRHIRENILFSVDEATYNSIKAFQPAIYNTTMFTAHAKEQLLLRKIEKGVGIDIDDLEILKDSFFITYLEAQAIRYNIKYESIQDLIDSLKQHHLGNVFEFDTNHQSDDLPSRLYVIYGCKMFELL